MKQHQLALSLGIGCLITIASCKKSSSPAPAPTPEATRIIHYILYTTQDFSTNTDTIRFQLYMAGNGATLFDSAIQPMTINAIPDSLHPLTFSKTVPAGHAQENLQVGFLYGIDHVGNSWFLDSSSAGQTSKTVWYNFR
ncbi:MAG TPA: hypothetical protein VMH27_13605 [Puia sp.]|nr:hypothetical protein [Puia sp.]